jgi:hypothetical protein
MPLHIRYDALAPTKAVKRQVEKSLVDTQQTKNCYQLRL